MAPNAQKQTQQLLTEFTINTVSGQISGAIKILRANSNNISINNDEEFVKYMFVILTNNLVAYFNTIYHSYHQKTDKYVTDSIDSIISYKVKKYPICIFNILIACCFSFLNTLKPYFKDLYKNKSIEFPEMYKHVTTFINEHKSKIDKLMEEASFSCGNDCPSDKKYDPSEKLFYISSK